jgi:hypothetical protein
MRSLVVVKFVLFLVALTQAQHCKWIDPNTKKLYDLSTLINNGTDYVIHRDNYNEYDFYINVCIPVITLLCVPDDAQASGCQV